MRGGRPLTASRAAAAPRRGLRQLAAVRDRQLGDRGDHVGHVRSRAVRGQVALDPPSQRRVQRSALAQRDQQHDALLRALLPLFLLDRQRLADLGDALQDAVDLRGSHPDAAHVEHAVAAPVQARAAPVPVSADELDQVPVRPDARVAREVGGVEARAVRVPEQAERARGEGIGADQLAYRAARLAAGRGHRPHVQPEADALALPGVDRQVGVAEHEAADDVRPARDGLQRHVADVLARPGELPVVQHRAGG